MTVAMNCCLVLYTPFLDFLCNPITFVSFVLYLSIHLKYKNIHHGEHNIISKCSHLLPGHLKKYALKITETTTTTNQNDRATAITWP